MEAPMGRRVIRPHLEARESFEATRLGPQTLIEAYARLVPARRALAGKMRREVPRATAEAARRRGDRHVRP
jgi:hypothetical protein